MCGESLNCVSWKSQSSMTLIPSSLLLKKCIQHLFQYKPHPISCSMHEFNVSNHKQQTQQTRNSNTTHTYCTSGSLFFVILCKSNLTVGLQSRGSLHSSYNTNGAIFNVALWPLRMRIHFTFASENSDVECALCEILLAFCYVKINHTHTHVECKNLFIQVL